MRVGIILANQATTDRPYRWVSREASFVLLTPRYTTANGSRAIAVPAACQRTTDRHVIRERACRSVEDRIALNRVINLVAPPSDYHRFTRPNLPTPVPEIQLFTPIGRPSAAGVEEFGHLASAQFINLDLSYPTALRTTSEHPHAALVRQCAMIKEMRKLDATMTTGATL